MVETVDMTAFWNDDQIPVPILRCIQALSSSEDLYGEEGVFRVPGDAKTVSKLNAECDARNDVDLAGCRDANTICGLLKLRCEFSWRSSSMCAPHTFPYCAGV